MFYVIVYILSFKRQMKTMNFYMKKDLILDIDASGPKWMQITNKRNLCVHKYQVIKYKIYDYKITR